MVEKPGYKQTAVGWIPNEWTCEQLNGFVTLLTGAPFKSIFFSPDEGIPLIRIRDLQRGFSETGYVGDYDDRYLVNAGDVLVGMDGEFHVVRWKGTQALLNQRVLRISEKRGRSDESFLFFLVANAIRKIQDGISATTVKHLSTKDLQNLTAAIPPLPEQQKIAAILTAVDDKLDVIARQIEVTQTLKRGLMQTLFSRNVGGGSDEDWLVVPLREVAEVRTGVAKGKKGLKEPIELPYLRVANVQDGHIDLSEVKTIAVEASQVERYALRSGDVLMTEGGDFDKLGRGDVWEGQIFPCLHQNHVFAVRPDPEKLNSYFLAALAASDYGKQYFLSCAKRTTNLASINSSQLKAFPVLLPPLEIQKEISEVVDAANAKAAVLESRQAALQNLKRGLMQKLLTGEWRVKLEAAEAVAA
ncbi:restriction endonuclease subunit S [Burkholderia cepacia]|uniref:restriction endonuclease subunit S n=1 Tax=Burkholderia cepacia TaxID=292 RepID=UPI001574F30E|nr:restriction endonuclease subunit S [Burkholderia cepacia]NTX22923.1 restriction endonuclease subunit S [Burkholderia cepacia]